MKEKKTLSVKTESWNLGRLTSLLQIQNRFLVHHVPVEPWMLFLSLKQMRSRVIVQERQAQDKRHN